MHGETGSIENFVLQKECALVGTLEELARLDRRLHRVVKRVVHGRRELGVLILEHHAESFRQEILACSLRRELATLHQVIQIGQVVQSCVITDQGWRWLGRCCRATVGYHFIRTACADIVDLSLQEVQVVVFVICKLKFLRCRRSLY